MNDLPLVAGGLEGNLATFERRCLLQLKEEQEKILPNNALIAVLCDAVRVKREYCQYVTGNKP